MNPMQKHFAKLFATKSGQQVLITYDGQGDDDLYRVGFRAEFREARVEMSFCHEDEKTARSQFDEFNSKQAFTVLEHLILQLTDK
jgi:hypothetical protein